jgi:hypothetical protein
MVDVLGVAIVARAVPAAPRPIGSAQLLARGTIAVFIPIKVLIGY